MEQQELFTALKLALESLGYAVYDGFMPPEGTPYPLIYLGEFRQADGLNKGGNLGNVFATIHVWSNTPRNRGTVSSIMKDIRAVCYALKHTDNYAWYVWGMNQRILPDNTTKTPLLHGVVEVDFKFS